MNILLFVPAAPKVLAEIKRTIYTAFCPLILRLELSHKAIENEVYYMTWRLDYHIIFQKRKENELNGQKS